MAKPAAAGDVILYTDLCSKHLCLALAHTLIDNTAHFAVFAVSWRHATHLQTQYCPTGEGVAVRTAQHSIAQHSTTPHHGYRTGVHEDRNVQARTIPLHAA